MSNVIDLSAATRGSQNAIGEAKHDEQLKQTALAQMLSVLNMSKPQLPPLQMAAIEQLQIEGIAVGVEFLANKCGGGENEWVKLIRSQIVEHTARRIGEANEAAEELAKGPAPEVADEVVDGVMHVSIGVAPPPNAENAGAVKTALLTAFIQLCQQFPSAEPDARMGRLALQWIPAEEGPAEDGGDGYPEDGDTRQA